MIDINILLKHYILKKVVTTMDKYGRLLYHSNEKRIISTLSNMLTIRIHIYYHKHAKSITKLVNTIFTFSTLKKVSLNI